MKLCTVITVVFTIITAVHAKYAGKDNKTADREEDEIFDVREIISRMGDSIYLKNEHVCNGDIEVRLEKDLERLDRCTVIEGDLVIATVNMRQNLPRWRFPRLKEITGKLIVYYTNLPRMDLFPNLAVIRGSRPLMGFSLVVMDTVLTHLHLPSLRLIQKGGVRVTKNHLMCYIKTIDWNLIIDRGNSERHLMVENNRGLCPDLCNQSLQCHKAIINEKWKELCWSPNVCQSVCDSNCKTQDLACWMNDTSRCCHEECLGGCYGNGTELCVSCKHFVFNGTCVRSCPSGFYEYMNRRCITKEECFTHMVNDPVYYKRNISYSIHDKKCVNLCPPQHRRNETTGLCMRCIPACPKRCGNAYVYGVKDLKNYVGCSSVRKLHISIRDGGEDGKLMDRLKKSLVSLETVEEHLKIINTGSLKTLSFLSNLKSIGKLNSNNSNDASDDRSISEPNIFEVLANDRLQSLWIPKDSKVNIYGRVHIHLNRQLCANKIFDFFDHHVHLVNGNLSEQQRTFIQKANGDLMPCNVSKINLTIDDVTARSVDVRWSPVDLTERDFFVTLLMIKPTKKNISLVDDRASCEKSSWQIHEATACVQRDEESGTMLTGPNCILMVPKLTPATRYAVYMESKTTQGDHGAVSDVVYFETATEPPTQPRDLELEALTWSSLKVSWSPPRHPNGKVTKYMIWYRPMKLRKQEFAGRNFCQSKLTASTEKTLKHIQNPFTNQFQNSSVCTSCEECLKKCGKNSLRFKTTEDMSHSFEDSLQNHIFVKRPSLTAAFGTVDSKFNGSTNGSIPAPKFSSTEKGHGISFTDKETVVDVAADTTEATRDIPAPTTATTPASVTTLRPKPRLNDNSWKSRVEIESDVTTYTFTNLNHYTEYIFAIRACHDAVDADNEDKLTSTYSTNSMYDDEIHSGHVSSKVCSKMEVANHRTLASDSADKIEENTVEVNKEYGVRVLWSQPKNPNGIILHYWFRYRKKDPEEQDDSNWNLRCITLAEWSGQYIALTNLRQSKGLVEEVTEVKRTKRSPMLRPPEEVQDKAMEAERGGVLCTPPSFPPGVYEFSIKAMSLHGNGSWTNIATFVVDNDTLVRNIIVVVLVVFVVVLIGLIIALVVMRRRRREDDEVIFSNPEYQKIPQPDEWEIPQSDIVYYNERALGKGHFGVVVKGFVKNLNTPAANFFEKTDTILAAIKTVRKDASFQEKLEFLSEANRMKTFHSYHVVQLLGVVSRMETRDAMPQVVMEFMSHGDLASYLNQIKEKEAINMLSETKILLWASQIADGMAYLSSNRVVHRDLAARNCLVDAQEVVKIADFGLTRELYYTEEAYKKRRNRGGVLGPFMWMAPESLSRGNFSSLSDVWSYGVVLWEVATLGARPYPNMSAMAVKDFVLSGNSLLTRDDLWDNSWKKLCPLSVLDLMRKCFQFHDKDRPSFVDILFSLDPYIDERFIKFSFYLNQG